MDAEKDAAIRRQLADEIVAFGAEALNAVVPSQYRPTIHWDDSNEGDWSFWIRVRIPVLVGGGTFVSLETLNTRRAFNAWRSRIKLRMRDTDYQACLSQLERPRLRRNYWGCWAFYTQDTWIFRLDFYGGPDAVFV